MMSESKYRVSVVVPTFKRPEMLMRCLTALIEQDFDATAYEVIVADDAACEKTRREVEAWARRVQACGKTLRYVPVTSKHGPAAARNAGWRAACGEIIAFTDDDCIPTSGWLKAGVAAFTNGVVGVAGQLIVPLEGIPTDYEHNAAGLATAPFVTANCFYHRDCLAQVGGFDERFTAAWREDSDLIFTLEEVYGGRKGRDRKRTSGRSARRGGGGEEWRGGPCGRPCLGKLFSRGGKVGSGGRPQGHPPLPVTTPAPTRIPDPFVYTPQAVVIHPLRPALWGVSLKQQRKSMFNALLYKKHPDFYRERIQAAPPWHYYGIVGAFLTVLGALLGRHRGLAFVAACLWLFLTGRFCWQRLRNTSHEPRHVVEMIVTSALIPPLAIFWRIRGAIKFRVFFL